ncbi:hypothetical protein ACFY4K_15660 [Streptomyces leeuwenhoekii]|uniref:hypothetical protein n=1 Tax=Streptomyces leeuwenhoekii TaxID=1437453 RepID=UPI0036A4BB51
MRSRRACLPPEAGTRPVEIASGAPGTTPIAKSYVNDWIGVDPATDTVRSLDMAKYLAFVATQAELRTTPAFDAVGVDGNTTSGTETDLFGPPTRTYMNYTQYGRDHNEVAGDGSGIDDTGLTWKQYTAKKSKHHRRRPDPPDQPDGLHRHQRRHHHRTGTSVTAPATGTPPSPSRSASTGRSPRTRTSGT